MKKLTLISLISLISVASFAQRGKSSMNNKTDKAEIVWGEEMEMKKATLENIIGSDENAFYAIYYQSKGLLGVNKEYYFQKYDFDMKKIGEKKLPMSYQGNDLDYEFSIHYNDNIYLFMSYMNKKTKKNYLFSQKIDKKTLRPERDIKKVAEIDFSNASRLNAGDFSYTISADSSKFMIYYNMPYKSRDYEKFGFHVLDKDMNEIYESKITLPYTDQLFSIEDYIVGNDASMHLLGIVYKNKKGKVRRGSPNYRYELLSYTDSGNDLTKTPIKLKDRFITEMKVELFEDEIFCAGFYSNVGTTSINGTYFLKINRQTKEIVSESYKEFSVDFISKNTTERKKKRNKRKADKGKDIELYRYVLDNLIIRSDGGVIVVGEQYWVTVRTYTNSNGTTTTTYTYHSNDIIVVSIDPDGNIEWAEKIAKQQVSTNDNGFYLSYNLSVINNKLYFVFNDNEKNFKYNGVGRVEAYTGRAKKTIVVLCEVDANGNFSKEYLYSPLEIDKLLLRPVASKQISPKEVILFNQIHGKYYRFGRLVFK